MKQLLVILCGLMLATGIYGQEKRVAAKPQIEIALLLDTSNSMDGLINQAKAHLWDVVNEFSTATRDGRRPQLQVALFEYGKSSLPAGEGYIRCILPLTDDLDKVSEELFALRTNGGQEYCGWVIQDAVEKLQWSPNRNDLKAIFIAGNEPFTQGKVSYVDACRGAIKKEITVNTIHCGGRQQGIAGKWQHGAQLADGTYVNIDHNQRIVQIKAPQDKGLAELNSKLNTTYVPYGATGKKGMARQMAQDRNAQTMSNSSFAKRSKAKAGGFYTNSGWDLVDAVNQNKVDLSEVDEKDLPEKMQKMTAAERKAYLAEKTAARQQIQARIKELNAAREKYVAAEMKKRGDSKESLDDAMIKSLRKQAEEKQFKF